MTLRLHNTLTKTKEDFVPLDPKNVRMYVCGPTVYDYAHIGNARPAIVFDVVFRLLRHLYGDDHVTYVRNITDVDDKINARALEISEAQKIPIESAREQLTAATAKQYHDDVDALCCLRPTREPRATEYIRQMILMIEMLIKKGHAYEQGGHVLYDVGSKKDYGKLSRRSVDDMIAGARVDVAPYKANPMDFVLWKPSTPEQPGWEHNKWGRGRPGWHIECSAMSDALLGETFDIHGGGIDLIFPHHENEIAQSEGAHGEAPPARYWMHNGFLQVEGEKMSKSLGNFVTIREILRNWNGRAWPGSAVRWAMLQTHYRQPIDWTLKLLVESTREILEILNLLRGRYTDEVTRLVDLEAIVSVAKNSKPSDAIVQALEDDLNLPDVISEIRSIKAKGSKDAATELLRNLAFLGVIRESDIRFLSVFHATASDVPDSKKALNAAANYEVARSNGDVFFANSIRDEMANDNLHFVERQPFQLIVAHSMDATSFDEWVRGQIAARLAAREAKNWKESDRIRDVLLARGIRLRDNPDGTTSVDFTMKVEAAHLQLNLNEVTLSVTRPESEPKKGD